MAKHSLCVTIITKNEAHDIDKCLSAVAWADEIVVVDSGSTDGTQDICLQYPQLKLFQENDWQGFGIQKQRALSKATSDWVLSLDADEIVTPSLRKEIEGILMSDIDTLPAGFRTLRQSYFCGIQIKYQSLWANDKPTRLVQRTKACFNELIVHEWLLVDGQQENLKNKLLHYTYRDYEEAIEKMNRYTTAEALSRYKNKGNISLFTAYYHAWWTFVRSYILRNGWRDGAAGFLLCRYMGFSVYTRYIKMMFLQRKDYEKIEGM
jgi:glycosyltransferase involved in cell wall biosynthesis